jgi:hypothetical protein
VTGASGEGTKAGDESGHAAGGGPVIESLHRTLPTAIVIVVLVTIAVRRYVSMANADALLPALMSTQQWTLFYWGQDRLANLVPLLTMPIRDPLWNFQIQTLLIAAAFFAVGASFVSYHFWARDHRPRPIEHAAASLLTGLLVMVPLHTVAGYRFIVEQLYFVSVLLFIAAIHLWSRRRKYALAGAVLQVAMLVNPSLLLATPFVWLLDHEPRDRIRRSLGFAAATLGAFALSSVAARYLATGERVDRPYDQFSIGKLREGVELVAGNVAGSVSDGLATFLVLASVAVVAAGSRRLVSRARVVYVAVPVFSALWFLAFSTNGWVIQNLYEFRYFYPLYVTFMLYVAGASTECVLLVAGRAARIARAPSPRDVAATAAALAFATAVCVVSLRHVRVEALEAADGPVEAARELDVDIVVGNYWTTWPTVIAGRSAGVDLLGAAFRSDPIHGDIRAAVDREIRDHGSVEALCSAVDVETCAGQLSDISGRRLSLGQVMNEQPLIITLVSTPGT